MLEKYKYTEVIQGGVSNRGNFIECPGYHNIDWYGKPNFVDCYHSAFMHSIDIKNYADEHGGKRGYKGSVGCGWLYWDLDSTNLETAYNDALNVISRLIENHGCDPTNIRMWFTGSKGFHVVYSAEELTLFDMVDNINDMVKSVCTDIAHGLTTFDTSVYDKTRVIRTPNSINSKTGLYKIELDFESGDSIEKILELAKTQHQRVFNPSKKMSESIVSMLHSTMGTSPTQANKKSRISASKLVEGIKYGFDDGERNVGLASIAGLLHRRNFTADLVDAVLQAINHNSGTPLPEREVSNIAESISRYDVDPLYIDPSASDILTVEDAARKWYELRKRSSRLESGFAHVDQHIPYFDPGEVLFVAARSGVGKTTLGMQLLNGIARGLNGYGLFASLEMPSTAIFVRSAIIEMSKRDKLRHTYDEVVHTLLEDTTVSHRVYNEWRNMLIIDKSCLTIEQIQDYHAIAQEKCGGNIQALLIDYVGLLGGTDDYKGISRVARQIKTAAKNMNTRVICISQLSREAGDGHTPVTMNMLRDSGALEESADYILGLWQSKQEQERIHAEWLKNRNNERGLKFDIINKSLSYSTTDPVEEGVW